MKRFLTSALLLSLFAFPIAGLSGCGEESKKEVKETVTTPTGSTTTTAVEKVDSTGSNPPANSAGETAKSPK